MRNELEAERARAAEFDRLMAMMEDELMDAAGAAAAAGAASHGAGGRTGARAASERTRQ